MCHSLKNVEQHKNAEICIHEAGHQLRLQPLHLEKNTKRHLLCIVEAMQLVIEGLVCEDDGGVQLGAAQLRRMDMLNSHHHKIVLQGRLLLGAQSLRDMLRDTGHCVI